MADNIIHLVLARIEGAPEGVKGISLFIVPKFLVQRRRQPRERNNAKCVGLEEKMGIHVNATCVMQYEDAKGWLVGETEQRPEDHVRDDERSPRRRRPAGPGPGGGRPTRPPPASPRTACRLRSLTGVMNPDGPADPIIVHPDVRRNAARHQGLRRRRPLLPVLDWRCAATSRAVHPDEEERQKADDYMQLLTPVIKGFLTDKGFKAAWMRCRCTAAPGSPSTSRPASTCATRGSP
jgi:alkylation response protein AidB-like acyl-CoA dehydrogenase